MTCEAALRRTQLRPAVPNRRKKAQCYLHNTALILGIDTIATTVVTTGLSGQPRDCLVWGYLVAALGAGLPGSPRPANSATLVIVECFASRFLRLRPAFCLRFLRFTFEALVFEAMTTILASEGPFSSRFHKAMSRFDLAGPRNACEYRV